MKAIIRLFLVMITVMLMFVTSIVIQGCGGLVTVTIVNRNTVDVGDGTTDTQAYKELKHEEEKMELLVPTN